MKNNSMSFRENMNAIEMDFLKKIKKKKNTFELKKKKN